MQHIEVDVLVNNAGFGAHGPIVAIGAERQLDMIEVNVAALTRLTALSFTEALAEEVRGSGVQVSCLAPGATDTGFAAQAGTQGTRLFRRGVMDAGRVARAGHDGMRRGRTLVIPGFRNRVLAFSVRLSPRTLATRVAGHLLA